MDLEVGTMKTAHVLAGGEKDIAVYLIANENAVGFYEKLGMKNQRTSCNTAKSSGRISWWNNKW